jgi:hypothetical protein
MMNFDRRSLLKGAAATGLASTSLLDFAKAWAQTSPWKPEPGAQLSMLRWKYFVQTEDDAFVALMNAFTKATGVKVDITRESYEDVQPKASVAANTNAGPGPVLGLYSLPHLFPQKCLDVTDVAEHLGKKYGGWARARSNTARAGQVDRDPGLLLGQPDQLPQGGLGQGRLFDLPQDHRRVHGLRQGHEGARARPAASRSAMLPATATAGCTGCSGRSAATLSTRTTRSSSTRRRPRRP